MAQFSKPPKNNIYSLMIIITTLVFVIGIVVGTAYLQGYKNLPEPRKPGSITLPDIEAQPGVDDTGVVDSVPEFDEIEFDDFDSDI